MTKTIAINSFRGGTGKSTITSSLAYHLASMGSRVLIIDADVRTPGVYAIFGLHEDSFKHTLTDFLISDCKLEEIIYDISNVVKLDQGRLFLVPSSTDYSKIANILVSKYSFDNIKRGFNQLMEEYNIDYILMDTHSGINDASLLAAELSDLYLLVIRPDNQHYQGLNVSAEVSKKLNIRTYIILNMLHSKSNSKKIIKQMEDNFGFPVISAIPHSEDVMQAESRYVLTDKFKHHVFSDEIRKISAEIMGRKPSDMLRRISRKTDS